MQKSFIKIIPGIVASYLHGSGDKSSVSGDFIFMGKLKKIDFVSEGSRLTFIKQTVFTASDNRKRWLNGEKQIMARAIYRCVCGNEIETVCSKVKSGHTKSCGCIRPDRQFKKHGLHCHPLYKVFYNIRKRCYTITNEAYPDYGGRGVVICSEWLNNPVSFIEWGIANGWRKGMEVDKDIIPKKLKIPALIYSPEMCTIATRADNAKAKRNRRELELNGVTLSLSEWSDKTGIGRLTISQRLKNGWSIQKALTTPADKKYHNGRRK